MPDRVTPPLFTFANDWHDRASEARKDVAEMDRRWEHASVLVVAGEHVATDGDDLAWRPSADVDAVGDRIYLGRADDGTERFAVVVDEVPQELAPQSLRMLAPVLGAVDAGLAAHAVGVAQWHRTHPHCSRCGARTEAAEAGHVRRCPVCGATHFPRSDPAVIMLVTDAEDRALLGHQAAWPDGRYSTLAGFVEPGESLEDAVRREIAEETGVGVGEVVYAGSQPWPFPASLMLGYYAVADAFDINVDGVEIAEARWFSRHDLAAACVDGSVVLPGRLSISRWLIEGWYGGELPSEWA
ncbi:NAD(+) diphosphatase [Solicola sp. PLA-1-18]|uniref:NAD(+) diphosphatase n=1 Tax=Solicola sp. PLA-1-18 TaxID=3380532 RepID=UPI003B7F3AC5